jgi:hypothetical protein
MGAANVTEFCHDVCILKSFYDLQLFVTQELSRIYTMTIFCHNDREAQSE